MGKLAIVLLAVLFIHYSKESPIATRRIGCTFSDCNDEAKKVQFDGSTAVMNGGYGIDISRSIHTKPKRSDCSSPMCWFRPGGKRESSKAESNVGRETEQIDKQCKSPMCWFRGKRRSGQASSVARKNAKWKKFLQKIKALTTKKARQISEDGCDSPMCWFRPGRDIKEYEYEKIMDYVREVNALKEAMKSESENQYELRAREKHA